MFVCLVDDIELPFDWLIDGAMFVKLIILAYKAVWLPETWHRHQFCWCTFVCCVQDLSHPVNAVIDAERTFRYSWL